MKTDNVAEVEKYLSKNMATLVKEYEQEIDEMEDSIQHKMYMLQSDECFMEWVADKYFEQTETEGA